MEIEAIVAGMPDQVQVVIKAPHFVANQNMGRVYWTKTLVDKAVAPSIISICENGTDKNKQKKAMLELEINELKEKIEKLEISVKEKDQENEILAKKLGEVRSSYESYSTEAEMLLGN